MALRLGSSTPSKLYLGATEVTKAYLGASVAYEVGGGAWTPAELGASLALWLDADDASTITLNGSTVSQWSDKSSNAIPFSQPTASRQPSYGASGLAKNTLNFDGLDDFLDGGDVLDTVWTGSAFQIFFVAKNNSADTNSGTILGKVSASPLDLRQFASYIRVNRSQLVTLYTPNTANYTVVNGSTVIADSQWVFSSQAYTDTGTGSSNTTERVEIVVDGAEQTEVVGAFSGILSTIADTDAHLSVGAIIGDGTQLGGQLDGSVGEILVTSTITSLADRQKLEGYLAWKWGLSYALPNDHPYKWDTSLFGGTDLSGFDADAKTYITSVETADKQDLETGVRTAVNDFVVGCKADGIWSAIKSSAILAGARTLNGALQPLVGTAPTNFNFVSGDYNRETGLIGNGTTKYLDSNRNNNADPQNSKHMAVYVGAAPTNTSALIGAREGVSADNGSSQLIHVQGPPASSNFRLNCASAALSASGIDIGLAGVSRTGASAVNWRHSSNLTGTDTIASQTPFSVNMHVFQRAGTSGNVPTNARMSFYSIGEAIDLALLDTRVSALMTAIDGAIP